ncbi:MAG: phosphomevalonate kinase [Candelina submexicana]|nr:MAG: phosphomevalonate kinase [Candelina submexicana]
MNPSGTAVSAPGKVLLAGGYLVLDREYSGLVFGLSARIHVHVKPLPTSSGVTISEIIVRSPQFIDAEWRYGYRLADNNGGIEVTQLKDLSTSSLSRNPFVETALGYALSYITTIISPNIEPSVITILADRDYYSQPDQPPQQASAPSQPQFIDFQVPLHEAHKTGLGSSAALVTALCASLLTHYLPNDVVTLSMASAKAFASSSESVVRPKRSFESDKKSDKKARLSLESKASDGSNRQSSTDSGKARLHNLAQAAHCAAQGKVGSGFDVAAAVYGSCIYKRFSPSVLEELGLVGSPGFARRLKNVVEDTNPAKRWDVQIFKSAVSVPRGLRLVMCDVDCGSQTVGMVKQMLAWRRRKPAYVNNLWAHLQRRNEEFGSTLTKLARSHYPNQNYETLAYTISAIRSLVREMTAMSGVPVEPPAQALLLSYCSSLTGVVGGVVPGAGGYDAIALLVEDRDDVMRRLHEVLSRWGYDPDGGEGPTIGRARVLGVREEMEGVKAESSHQYSAWL